ncbi:MAG: PEP-CTERM system TPR-repeat protein PrsT [Burkholderiaceae bacterium]|jgi:putative PEP-CTERM system TPR-repeat lipoprotein|nr:PEP-CTERM system TPR-repeat protein PrsT [Burkholderiaceae bacterium]
MSRTRYSDAVTRSGLPPVPRWHRLALVTAIALTLGACGGDSPEKLMSSAKAYLAQGDEPAAVIQLRNVLQKNPQQGEARLLLGKALLRQGDPLAAEKELRRALEFGQPAAAVLPPLAQAMLELAQVDALIKEFGERKLDDAGAQAALRASVGDARLRLGRIDDARRDYEAALAAQPGLAQARLGQAVLALYDGKRDDARAIVEQVIAADARNARAHALRSDLLLAGGDSEGAKASLQRAIEADPRFTVARLAMVSLLLGENRLDEAGKQIEAGLKASRGDSRLVLMDATLAMRKGDRAGARSKVQQVLKVAPDHVPSLLLAGQIELADGQVASSQQHLRRALNRAPGHEGVRRTLAASYLRGGQPARALEALQPLIAETKALDPALLMLAGETYLANGDLKQATAYFSQASAGGVQKAAAQTRLGQIALASGDPDAGLKQLESAAAIEGSGHQADLALIAAHLRRNDFDKAAAAARALEKKAPNEPLSHHMLGVVAAARKDGKAAREHFGKAIELSPAYLPSLGALASLDLADKQPEAARKRFEALIARDAKNEVGYLGLAEIQGRTGASPQELADTLQRGIAAAPQSAALRIGLANLLLGSRDAKGALAAAQSAASALPNDARVLETLARAQDAAGDYNQSIDTLQKIVALQPEAPQPWQKMAAVHVKHRQFDRALDALRRAQRLVPDDGQVAAQIAASIASTAVLAGRPDEAIKEARTLQSRQPGRALGHAIEGEAHAVRKDWAQAERALRDALKLTPRDGALAVRLHAVYAAAGRAPEAAAHARKWLLDNPRDVALRMHLADVALRDRNHKAAFGLYQEVIGIAPDNVIAMNNLAWVAGELRDARAVGYAERALALAPNSASVLDTLGVLLVRQGEARRGMDYLERARAIEPNRPDLQLHHAQGLMAVGRKDEARKALEALAQRPESFPGKDTIPQLLKSL